MGQPKYIKTKRVFRTGCFIIADMNLEQVAAKIMVNYMMAKTEGEAVEKLMQEFKDHFPGEIYAMWNKEVPDSWEESYNQHWQKFQCQYSIFN